METATPDLSVFLVVEGFQSISELHHMEAYAVGADEENHLCFVQEFAGGSSCGDRGQRYEGPRAASAIARSTRLRRFRLATTLTAIVNYRRRLRSTAFTILGITT